MNIFYIFAFLLPFSSFAQDAETDIIRIGLVADIQYSDQETSGSRYYRNSLEKVSTMIENLNHENIRFLVDLGDRIDRGYESFMAIESILKKSSHPIQFVPGNHDYLVEDLMKPEVTKKTNSRNGYHSKTINTWHFIFLNGLENSLKAHPEGSTKYKKAAKDLEKIKEAGSSNAYVWNGGLGKKQTSWLKREIRKAQAQGLNLIIFCHQPIFPNNAHSLWDYESITETLADFPNRVWWISGHDHKGGFEVHDGINMLTMHGMVEGLNPSYGILEISANEVRLLGSGDQPDL